MVANYNSKWQKIPISGSLSANKGNIESIFGIQLYNGKTSIPVDSVNSFSLANQYIMLSKVNLTQKSWFIFPLSLADTLLEIGERKDEISEPYIKFNGTFKEGKLVFLSKRSEKGNMIEMTFGEFKNEVPKYFGLNSFKDFQEFFYLEGLSDNYRNLINPLLETSNNLHDIKVNIFGKRKGIAVL